jgi:hypothetical protein
MSAPLPDDHSLVQPVGKRPSENVRRQIAPLLAAQRAVGQDPGVGHGFDGGGNVLTAGLASEDEFAFPSGGDVEHGEKYRRTKGEYQGRRLWMPEMFY